VKKISNGGETKILLSDNWRVASGLGLIQIAK